MPSAGQSPHSHWNERIKENIVSLDHIARSAYVENLNSRKAWSSRTVLHLSIARSRPFGEHYAAPEKHDTMGVT